MRSAPEARPILRERLQRKESEVFGPSTWDANPELVRKDRGAGDPRVAKLTKTGKSTSRRTGAWQQCRAPFSFGLVDEAAGFPSD